MPAERREEPVEWSVENFEEMPARAAVMIEGRFTCAPEYEVVAIRLCSGLFWMPICRKICSDRT
jgi:hypothetical protein